MYFALPVLSVEDMSVDYLLESGVNGYKLADSEFTDMALQLTRNQELLQRLSLSAKSAADSISPKEVATEHIDVYQYCLENFAATNLIPSRIQEAKTNTFNVVANSYRQLKKYYTGLTDNIGFPFK
jgi:hypothetical protein